MNSFIRRNNTLFIVTYQNVFIDIKYDQVKI